MNYGPWPIVDCIYDKRGTVILITTDPVWVVKAITDSKQSIHELYVVLGIHARPPRHCVALPQEPYWLYGRTQTAGWYALKRYRAHITSSLFFRTQWRTLAIHVLQFLQDFHHIHRLVHMDIKKGNILYDMDPIHFVVADYEHAEAPREKLTRDYDNDHKWYYISIGAELDKPLVSWRLDLVALGYVLASLTTEPAAWTFEIHCWDKREGPGDIPEEKLLELRATEVADVNMNPTVRTFLDRVASVDWAAKEPPPRAFYLELEALFV